MNVNAEELFAEAKRTQSFKFIAEEDEEMENEDDDQNDNNVARLSPKPRISLCITQDCNSSLLPQQQCQETPADNSSAPEKTTSPGQIYECFAPPGPLGIVIETGPDGPQIHSLKPRSQLSGLIFPGDLIIAVDDIDTREMTAATISRLVAKKAQQTQRKIKLQRSSPPETS